MKAEDIARTGPESVAAGWIGGTPSRNAPSVSATGDTPPDGSSHSAVPTSQTDANRSQPRSAARCTESGTQAESAPRRVMERGARAEPTDTDILDWLQTLMRPKGRYQTMGFSDSRDMGYRSEFLAFWINGGQSVKGNSVREVMLKMMAREGWKRRAKKRAAATTEDQSSGPHALGAVPPIEAGSPHRPLTADSTNQVDE